MIETSPDSAFSVLPRRELQARSGAGRSDAVFRVVTRLAAFSALLFIVGIGLTLLLASRLSLAKTGLHFFLRTDSNDANYITGVLSVAYGTLVTSAIALIIAVPLGVGAAIFLSEIAPRRVAAPISFFVEMLAAVPSIVYGFWAVTYLKPLLYDHVEPWLTAHFGQIPLFMDADYNVGLNFFTAGVILAIMVLPFITAISRDVLRTVPAAQREAAYGLGATKWEAIRGVVVRYAGGGIIGAVMLGLGRALGETMAVTLVIGDANPFAGAVDKASFSLFRPGSTMTSAIANHYLGASNLNHSSLTEVALSLFFITIAVNGLARGLVWLTAMRAGGTESAASQSAKKGITRAGRIALLGLVGLAFAYQIGRDVQTRGMGGLFSAPALLAALLAGLAVFNRVAPGKPYFLLWRKIGSGFALGVCAACAFLACGILALIFYFVALRGFPTLTPQFFQRPENGGMLHAIVGTALLALLASLIGIPLGILGGVYLAEFGDNPLGWRLRFAADLLNGVPSIVLGIFAYVLIYAPLQGYEGFAGGFALGVMMTPTVMRTTEELLRLVPTALREGSLALGATQARTTWKVILPAARSGIVTGVLLALARIAGETAPLLIVKCDNTAFNLDLRRAVASLPTQIYSRSAADSPVLQGQLWGVSLLLVLLVLVFSLLARFATRDKMKMSA